MSDLLESGKLQMNLPIQFSKRNTNNNFLAQERMI